MQAIRQKRLMAELRKYRQDQPTNVLIEPSDTTEQCAGLNCTVWWALFYYIPNTPYENGVYLIKVFVPDKYPTQPPHVMMITPSGRFRGLICTTDTGYHPDSRTVGMTIPAFLVAMMSFMTEEGGDSIGSVRASEEERRRFADDSMRFNLTNETFCRVFPYLGLNKDDNLVAIQAIKASCMEMPATKRARVE